MTRILGVHGVGNYRAGLDPAGAARRLASTWQRALAGGPLADGSGVKLAVAYYAHHLRVAGSQGVDGDLDELDPTAREMAYAWIDAIGLPEDRVQGPGTYPLRQALAWLAARRRLSPRLLEWFVATFFGEVARYLRAGPNDTRDAIRATVHGAIQNHGARIVIAHSLGSVVAYEALWQLPTEIDLLITMGSPLAMPHAVFPRLTPAPVDGLGARPPGVHRWVNLADLGDLIAIPIRGISQQFHHVNQDVHCSVHAFDFHLVANYLKTPTLAEVLRPHLASGRP
jgi:hypothetical protein